MSKGHTKPEQDNREAWLTSAADALSAVFYARGYTLPDKLRVSLGWVPSRKRGLGCCHPPEMSAGGYTEVFISPIRHEPLHVLSTLTHELCHAAVGTEHAHDRTFAKCARCMDLEGKPTVAYGYKNIAWLNWAVPLANKLGAFPHDSLIAPPRVKQTTRMVPRVCTICGFKARASSSWFSRVEASGEVLRCPDPKCDGKLK